MNRSAIARLMIRYELGFLRRASLAKMMTVKRFPVTMTTVSAANTVHQTVTSSLDEVFEAF